MPRLAAACRAFHANIDCRFAPPTAALMPPDTPLFRMPLRTPRYAPCRYWLMLDFTIDVA